MTAGRECNVLSYCMGLAICLGMSLRGSLALPGKRANARHIVVTAWREGTKVTRGHGGGVQIKKGLLQNGKVLQQPLSRQTPALR